MEAQPLTATINGYFYLMESKGLGPMAVASFISQDKMATLLEVQISASMTQPAATDYMNWLQKEAPPLRLPHCTYRHDVVSRVRWDVLSGAEPATLP